MAIASPEKFEELLAGFNKRGKISDFLSKCEDLIENDAQVRAEIAKLKNEGNLIPYIKREPK